MKSFSTLSSLYQTLSNNSLTANVTLGTELMNDGIREIHGMPFDWWFLEGTTTDSTVALQQTYQLPYNFEKIKTVTITVGSDIFPLIEIDNQKEWDNLNQNTYYSDFPTYFFIVNDQIKIFPIPSSSSNTITFVYKKKVKDLGTADYTTGTITATNGSAAITGSGTTFTAAMVGRYLKVNNDGYWYEIASYTSATSITLKRKFQGTTVAGASYTIGEMPILPENFHKLPVWYALKEYYLSKNEETNKAVSYENKWNKGIVDLIKDNKSRSTYITSNFYSKPSNPNLFLTSAVS